MVIIPHNLGPIFNNRIVDRILEDSMREMGITDERMAKRALEVMGGDVQAAIDLIYSGWEGAE